jgi:serine phosphatase RsbU (regulator of sigma subunit)
MSGGPRRPIAARLVYPPHMYEDDTLLQRTLSLLRAQQEATIDGILVVNERRRLVSCNRRFLELWGIPAALAESGDDEAMIGHVLGSLRDPGAFLARIVHLYGHPQERSRDELALRDGRLFDRYSAPVIGDGGENFGRIWIFRDVTDQRRAEAALRADLEQARAFQQSILPAPPTIPGAEVDVVYRPQDNVGGDLYHAAVDDDRLRLFIADATGHGVSAGLTTMLLYSEYEAVRLSARRPAEVLRALNERLVRRSGRGDMRFTALCAEVDLRSGALCWSAAAHPPALLFRGGAARELETGGPFIGLAAPALYPEWSLALEAGDALCLYTDGIVDARDEAAAAFGEARLAAALQAAAGAGGAAGADRPLAHAVLARAEAFVGEGRRFGDDATVLTLRWRGD